MQSVVEQEYLTTLRLAEHERSVAQWQLSQAARHGECEQDESSRCHRRCLNSPATTIPLLHRLAAVLRWGRAGRQTRAQRAQSSHRLAVLFLCMAIGAASGLFGFRASAQSLAQDAGVPTISAGAVTILTASGMVLIADDFSNPDAGVLPHHSEDPAYQLGYIDGEYEIAKRISAPAVPAVALVPGTYEDSAIEVDTRLVADSSGGWVGAVCRSQGPTLSGYLLALDPSSGVVDLIRVDQGAWHPLAAGQMAESIRGTDRVNHIELSCMASTISASINGMVVATVQDDTYSDGQLGVTASTNASTNSRQVGAFDARFSNLVATGMPSIGAFAAPHL
jgi:hypothetical protein